MVDFPAVTPTSMSFTAPEFPVRSNTSLGGVVSRRLFGNRGSRATLTLGFENLEDWVAVDFLNAWNAARGQFDPVSVSSVVFDGAEQGLLSYLANGGDQLVWHFAEPPQIERIVPGISSVQVTLEATRDF